MYATIIIASISCLALIGTVIFKPEITIKKFALPLYPIVALIGAIFTLCITPLTFDDCTTGVVESGAVNPIKILALFIAVSAISVFLDESGFFEFLAHKMLSRAGGNQRRLFFLLYITVSVLTVFTSNDIIILTFTPFIIYFCKNAGIRAFPYLISEFVAANTWSMALLIGNPTNIYLATTVGIDFFTYMQFMILPAILAGTVSVGILYLMFGKTLALPFDCKNEPAAIKDKPMCILGCVMLIICTLGLALSGFIGVEMWIECLICLGLLIVIALIICAARRNKPSIVGRTLLRLPYPLIPFVLSMFIIALALDKTGITCYIANAFSSHELVLYGISSFFASNLVNNIPMSIIFSSMITAGNAGTGAVFASIIGSNLGAILTPIGAMAGIMFSSICKKHGEKISVLKFIGYGACVSAVSMTTAVSALALMTAII